MRKIEELQDKKAQLIASKQSIEKDLAYMEIWGEFSYQNINRLKRAGYDVTFFTCPTAKYEPEWGVLYNAILINNFQSVTYFITITKEGTLIDIDADVRRCRFKDWRSCVPVWINVPRISRMWRMS